MEFRNADTLTDCLSRLTTEEQKAVNTTAFDLQLNPAAPGMNFHKIDSAKDPNFWSVRVNADIWLIVHKSASSLHRTSHRSGFYHHGTERMLIVDLPDPSKIPALAEPWFLTFEADVEFRVVMSLKRA